MNAYKLNFNKERFKFSAAHFTLFNAQSAECLHGHNYTGTVSIEFHSLNKSTGMLAPFNELKKDIEKTFSELDELTLIPKNSPFLKIKLKNKNIEVKFNNKFYSLPKEDVSLLPLVNITSELLAYYIFHKLFKKWKKKYNITQLLIGIQESSGQTAYYGGDQA